MKKTILVLIGMLVMLSSFCLAGSIGNLCTLDFWGHCIIEVSDDDVDVDADTLDGTSLDTINEGISTAMNQKPKGEPGLGKNDLSLMLVGSGYLFEHYDFYTEYILEVVDAMIEEVNERIDLTQAMCLYSGLSGDELALKAGIITAKRTGEKVEVDGFICSWYKTDGNCIKVS